jgi:hypothetical protein
LFAHTVWFMRLCISKNKNSLLNYLMYQYINIRFVTKNLMLVSTIFQKLKKFSFYYIMYMICTWKLLKLSSNSGMKSDTYYYFPFKLTIKGSSMLTVKNLTFRISLSNETIFFSFSISNETHFSSNHHHCNVPGFDINGSQLARVNWKSRSGY